MKYKKLLLICLFSLIFCSLAYADLLFDRSSVGTGLMVINADGEGGSSNWTATDNYTIVAVEVYFGSITNSFINSIYIYNGSSKPDTQLMGIGNQTMH